MTAKSAPFRGGDRPHLTYGSLRPTSSHPKRHLDRFIRFSTAHVRDQQTATNTPDKSHYSSNSGPVLCYAWRCGLKIHNIRGRRSELAFCLVTGRHRVQSSPVATVVKSRMSTTGARTLSTSSAVAVRRRRRH